MMGGCVGASTTYDTEPCLRVWFHGGGDSLVSLLKLSSGVGKYVYLSRNSSPPHSPS